MCSIQSNTGILDTLQTSDDTLGRSTKKSPTKLHNRRSRKALTRCMAKALCGLESMKKADRNGHTDDSKKLRAYIKMHECAQRLSLIGLGGHKYKARTQYCNHRGCLVCSSIRSAKMMNAYAPQLNEIKDLYFVTLTDVNVKADALKDEINRFGKNWTKIRNRINRHNKRNPHKMYRLDGIRTIECTYNWKDDNYNPHTHILVSSKETAELILKYHFEYHPTAGAVGQHIKKADAGGLKELFKYVAKGLTNDCYSAQVQDNIYTAFKDRKQYYPFGNIKKTVDEDLTPDDLIGQIEHLGIDEEFEVAHWNDDASILGDWVTPQNVPLLGKWNDDKKTKKYIKMIHTVRKENNKSEPDELGRNTRKPKNYDSKRKTSETITDEDIQILRSRLKFFIDNGIELF